MQQILIFLLVLVVIALITLILLQRSKGADIGAAFGSGASNTVFGSQGSGSFLLKLTLVFAVAFFIICITLARIAVEQNKATQTVHLKSTNTQPKMKSMQGSAKDNIVDSNVPAIPIKK